MSVKCPSNQFDEGLPGCSSADHKTSMRSYVRWVNGRHALFGVQAGRDVIIGGSLTTDMSVVPDYVFEAGYPLMPLVELEAFVKQEKHLPNVPSAEEIGKVNMTELQMKLLEKIEELTLYTLQQKDRIRTLLQRLEAVEAGRDNGSYGGDL